MQTFDIIRISNPKKTFRVANVIGTFDLQSSEIKEHFKGSFQLPEKWDIGVIVGNSGTGKTTIAKEIYKDEYITNFEYSTESVLDDMPTNATVSEITKAFNSVGFSSPPSWLKSYHVLSNGEKMRCDLARAILSENELFVFDEYTSVVDRNVAKIGSLAIQKAIRKSNKQFIAVGCHFDIIEWLMPDWVFNTNNMTFQSFERQKKNPPTINIKIYETKRKSEYWKMFNRYHYLSHSHNNASRVFIMTANDDICGFCSVLPFPHSKIKNHWREHRTVILPDFQGVGLSRILTNNVAELLKVDGKTFISTSSHPAIIQSRKKDNKWAITNYGRKTDHTGLKNASSSINRITASFKYIG